MDKFYFIFFKSDKDIIVNENHIHENQNLSQFIEIENQSEAQITEAAIRYKAGKDGNIILIIKHIDCRCINNLKTFSL